MKTAPADIAEKLRAVIATAIGDTELNTQKPFDLARAEQVVQQLSRSGKLVDQTVKRFAIDFHQADVAS